MYLFRLFACGDLDGVDFDLCPLCFFGDLFGGILMCRHSLRAEKKNSKQQT